MLEGGGKTPILNPTELEEIGYKLVAYPLSLMGVSIGAMQVRHLLLVLFLQFSFGIKLACYSLVDHSTY